MWSPDRLLRRAVVVLACLALAGCFRPMYATLDNQVAADGTVAPGLDDRLAGIEIAPVDGRVAQRVRNELAYGLNGGAGNEYRLTLSVNQSIEDVIVRRTREPEAQILVLRVRFTLTDQTTGKVVHGGNVVARASYDRSEQIFANERAKLDAENRAARVVANSLKTRIAGYFASLS